MFPIFAKGLLLAALLGTALAAYTTYVQDYHSSTSTLHGYYQDPRGSAGPNDFPAHPTAQENLANALESTNPLRTTNARSAEIYGLLRESHENSRYLLQTVLHPDRVGSLSANEKAWLEYYKSVYGRIKAAFQDNRAHKSALYNVANDRGLVDRPLEYVKTTGTTISRAIAHLG